MGRRPSTDIIFGFSGDSMDKLVPEDEETYEPHYSTYGKWDNDSWVHVYKERTGKEVEESGCIFGTWGYSEDSAEFVGIKATHFNGDWEEAGVIPSDFMSKHDVEEMTQKLKEFCEVMGVTFQDPKWLVLSSYG